MTRLDEPAKGEIKWWLRNVATAQKLINQPPPTCFITTDASMLGWGAVYKEKSCGGQWSKEESEFHINVLELRAIDFGLKSFLGQVQNEHIRVKTDNTTAVAYINHKGGIRSIECHEVARSIWEWAIAKKCHISAEHLPGSQNTLADRASRIFDVNTEWSLDNEVFFEINNKFGNIEFDLFASRLNNKHEKYASWKPDPNATFIDCFSRPWTNLKFYAFPPFSMVLRTIMKVDRDSASGILVCPVWPTQAWFPKLVKMLVAPPLILSQNKLSLPFKPSVQHKQANLFLMACAISGSSTKAEAFQRTLLTSSVPPGGPAQSNNMQYILKSGSISVLKDKVIPCHFMK